MEENNKLKMIKTILNNMKEDDIISNIIPSYMNERVLGVIREVYSKSIGTMPISLIFMLFASDKGLFALMRELHFMEV